MNKHTSSVSLIDGHIEDRTDAEIKKALELCSKGFGNCDGCPYDDNNVDCVTLKGETLMLKDALDLIKRQQAEIQKLEKIERFATKTIEKQTAEIEKLNVELVGMRGACESYKMHYDNAQAEIERLKELTTSITLGGKYRYDVATKAGIDYLVKEMTEVKENG